MTLESVRRFLERVYHKEIQNNQDRVLLLIGSEGRGKSTFALQIGWIWEEIRGHDPGPETVLDRVVFDDRDSFRDKLLSSSSGDPIIAMDAAHILYRKEAMSPEQIQTEKDFLDVRIGNFLIILAYQDWDDIPDFLQRRRAHNAFYIPIQGQVKGFSRKQLDEKYAYPNSKSKEWPEAALYDRFPSLEGTRIWERFNEIDSERKIQRIRNKGEDDEEPSVTPQEVVESILNGDVGNYIGYNEFQERAYVDKALVRFDYPALSDQQAQQVKAAIRRDVDITQYVESEEAGEEGTDT